MQQGLSDAHTIGRQRDTRELRQSRDEIERRDDLRRASVGVDGARPVRKRGLVHTTLPRRSWCWCSRQKLFVDFVRDQEGVLY